MNQSINTDSKNIKEPQQKYRLGTVSIKIPLITGGVAYNFVFSNCIINKGVWLSFALCMLTRNSVQFIVVNLFYWCYCCLHKCD